MPHPGHFTPGKEMRHPLYRKMGGSQGQSGHIWKILLHRGFKPQTIQPIVSHYTNYTTAAIFVHHSFFQAWWKDHMHDQPWIITNVSVCVQNQVSLCVYTYVCLYTSTGTCIQTKLNLDFMLLNQCFPHLYACFYTHKTFRKNNIIFSWNTHLYFLLSSSITHSNSAWTGLLPLSYVLSLGKWGGGGNSDPQNATFRYEWRLFNALMQLSFKFWSPIHHT
jgi:hypothetical protein